MLVHKPSCISMASPYRLLSIEIDEDLTFVSSMILRSE
jgi:hypothetical protein